MTSATKENILPDVVVVAKATGPRGPSGSPAPAVASVEAFRTSNFSSVDSVLVAGYYGVGTQGGGLFTYDSDAGGDNGGTVLHDVNGRPYIRVDYSGSVYEWGARCNATQVFSPGSIAVGSHVFTAPLVVPTMFKGERIAIAGAGAGGAPLATVISDIDVTGLQITLADAATTKTPTYLPTAAKTIGVGIMSGYVKGDTAVMSDGTTVQATTVDGSGAVTNYIVLMQGAPLDSIPSGSLTQVSTSGVGTGFTCTLTYAASGQYVYSSDDAPAINAAIAANSSAAYACDTYIPQNGVCGVASSITVSGGRGHLRGFDRWHSGLIALASMPRVFWRDASGGFGGGLHDIFVDAFCLAPAATEQSNGRYFIWENIVQNNATLHGHVASGPSTDANGGTSYSNCFARYVQSVFGSTHLCQKRGFDFQNFGGPAFVSNVQVSGVWTADPTGDPSCCVNVQTTGIHLTGGNVFGASPYSPVYGIDAGKQCEIMSVQVGGSTRAGFHIAAASVVCIGNFVQWGNSNYQDPGNCHGVIIEATGSPLFVDRIIVTGTTCDPGLNAANIVTQVGTSGPNNIVQNNAGASYTFPATSSASPDVLYATPAANSFTKTAQTASGNTFGGVLFNAYDVMFRSLGSRLAAAGLFYVLATTDETTALYNLANFTSGASLIRHGGLSFTPFRGYTGNGIDAYLDTQVATQSIPGVSLGSMTMLTWTGTPDLSVDNSYVVGGSNANRNHVNPRAANGNMRTRSQTTATDDAVANPGDSVGMFGWSRTGTSGYTQYIDGLPVGSPTQTATTNFGGNALLLCDGTTFSARTVAAALVCGGLSDADVLAWHGAVKTFLQTVGAPT